MSTAVNIGSDGFKWFLGSVVDLDDPLKLGRVKVKIFQEHDDKVEKEDLFWATVMVPSTSASLKTVGISPTGILKDSYCVGFYIDGKSKQHPIIIGTWHKMPELDPEKSDVTKLATGKQILTKEPIGPEPESAYGTVYPNNKVHHTLSGHAIEIDDTPGAERLHVYHKSGSYVEINHDGRIAIKSVDSSYEVITKDKHVYVKGNANVRVDGDLNAVVKGNITIAAEKDVSIHAKGKLNLYGEDGVNIRAATDVAVAAPGGVNITQGGLSTLGPIASAVAVTGAFSTPSGKTVHVTKGIVSNIF